MENISAAERSNNQRRLKASLHSISSDASRLVRLVNSTLRCVKRCSDVHLETWGGLVIKYGTRRATAIGIQGWIWPTRPIPHQGHAELDISERSIRRWCFKLRCRRDVDFGCLLCEHFGRAGVGLDRNHYLRTQQLTMASLGSTRIIGSDPDGI